MRDTSLDIIVRKYLADRGLTIHDYVNCLSLACTCLSELNFDTVRTVKSAKIPVNSYGAVPLPSDFVDLIKVGFQRGQYVVPMVQNRSLNRMNNYDDNGQKVKFENIVGDEVTDYSFLDIDATYYNYNAGDDSNGYRLLRERGEIQLDNRADIDYVYIQYIGDGLDTNAETEVHPYAVATIRAYLDWQRSPNYTNIQSAEGYNFFNTHRLLRSRLNDMSLKDIYNSKQKGFTQVPK